MADDVLAVSDETADLLFRTARTARRFTDQPVSDAQLTAIHELVKYGPTAGNGQQLRITFVRSQDAKSRLLRHLDEGNRPKSEQAPVVAVLSADRDFHEHLPLLAPHSRGARERWESDPEARWHEALLSAHLQAGYFIIAARAVGLAAGPMSGFDADAMSAEFHPDGSQRAFLVVNLGYPAEDAWRERAPRLTFDQQVTVL
jgi:3-hydroxypropanoate dehydrogenase